MSNPKSKMPKDQSYFDDGNILQYQMEGYVNGNSWNGGYSGTHMIEPDEQDSVSIERTDSNNSRPEIRRSGQGTLARVKRTKSLRITYDPDRDAGEEYLIEKVDDDAGDIDLHSVHNDGYIPDSSPDGLNYFPAGFENDEPIHLYRSNSVTLDNAEIGNDSEKENVENLGFESDIDISEQKSVSLESFQDSEPFNTPEPSSPLTKIESPQHIVQESPEVPVPQYIEPYPKQEVAPEPEPEITPAPERIFEPEPEPEPGPIPKLDLDREPHTAPLVNTLDSAKDSIASSIPPANFKTSLFKHVRRVSTPRKTPRFTPRPERTPSKTPVIHNLGYTEKERDIITPGQISRHSTFVKDSFDKESLSRFQRHDSSDSIRIHYDKHIKREETESPDRKYLARYEHVNVDTNARTSFKFPERMPKSKHVIKETRDIIKSPKIIERRTVNVDYKPDSAVEEKTPFDTRQYENHLSVLAKRPVPRKVPIIKHEGVPIKPEYVPVKQEINAKPQSFNLGDRVVNTKLEEDSDDIFSESDQRSKLKQPKYITDGLKLVKKKVKVKETEMTIRQTLAKQEQDSSKKRSVLKSLNTQRKQSVPQRSNLPTKLPRPAKRASLKLLDVKHHDEHYEASESGIEGETESTSIKLWNNRTKVLNRNRNRFRIHRPSIDTKSSIPTQSQYSAETIPARSSNTWNPQPKLHRPKQIRRPPRKLHKNSKRSDRTFFVNPATTASTTSVERWVVQTIKENTINRETISLPKIKRENGDMGLRTIAKKPKLKVRLQKKKKKTSGNMVNLGMYLPLPTKPRHRAGLFTQVGKVKGYEEMDNYRTPDGQEDEDVKEEKVKRRDDKKPENKPRKGYVAKPKPYGQRAKGLSRSENYDNPNNRKPRQGRSPDKKFDRKESRRDINRVERRPFDNNRSRRDLYDFDGRRLDSKPRDASNKRGRSYGRDDEGRGSSGTRGSDGSNKGTTPSDAGLKGYQYNDDNDAFSMINENAEWESMEGNSEIPVLHSDDDDDAYHEQRPNTVNDRRRYFNYRRYEGDGDYVRINYRDPAHRKVGRTNGALVRFFRNNDKDHKGLPLTINRQIVNFESLLQMLNDKIPTPTGIKYIFQWPGGNEIKSVTQFQNRCVYVVSSTNKLNKDIAYGDSRENYWLNGKPQAGKVRSNEFTLFKKPRSPQGSPKAPPKVVTIVHNLNRQKKEKVILNPHTQQTFEQWLEDNGVRDLYIDRSPYSRIRSFSHLFNELRNKTSFIGCRDNELPVELTKQNNNNNNKPDSNSSLESGGPDARGRGKKSSRQDDSTEQVFENGRPSSPTSTSMSRYDTGPVGRSRNNAPPPGRALHLEKRRGMRGCVHIDIDGVTREFWPPSYHNSDDDGVRPNQMLKIQWVYGFRGRDARHNLCVIPGTGEMVYYVASIVVLYDKIGETQRHYDKHNEEVSCLTLHPNGDLIATGQLHGKDPEHSSHIRIWDHETLSTYSVIGLGVFYGGIISIGFSPQGSGNLMCALDGSSKHVLSVWRVSLDKKARGDDSNYIIARTSTTTDAVHCACFYPHDDNNSILVTYGAKHIYFWKIFYDTTKRREAKIFRDRSSGIFEEHCPKSINCLAFLGNGDIVTGDTSGNLMIWDRDNTDAFTCKYVVQAHKTPILSVVALMDGTVLSGAGTEIKGWDSTQDFKNVSTRNFTDQDGGVRSIVPQRPGGYDGGLYIGTTGGCILEGSMKDKFETVVQGHSDRIWGLEHHMFEPTFFTAGADGSVYKWNVISHGVRWRARIGAPCTSLAVEHQLEVMAVGTSNGKVAILNAHNASSMVTLLVGGEPITCVSYSPNGMFLAVGCNDGLITIFNVYNDGKNYVKAGVALRGHNSGVAHLDWSRDSNHMQSVSHDNELLFWDMLNFKQNKVPTKTRDVDWFTNTCPISYSLIGPLTNCEPGEQVKVVNRSMTRNLVLVGDNVGRLRLYKYPCSREAADFRNVRVYSSDVTAATLGPDSRIALTCGGNDAALIQWTVEDDYQNQNQYQYQ